MYTMSTEQTFTVTDDQRHLETLASFNSDKPLTLSVTNASGEVSVSSDDSLSSGTVKVMVERTDSREFDEDDHHLTVKVEGNSISIHPDWQFASGVSGIARRIREQLQNGFRPEDWSLSKIKLSPELDFHISVFLQPSLAEESQVRIRTASGDVTAKDFVSGTSIATASGDVNTRNLTGVIAIHTASGDVHADQMTESLEINTASGDVLIKGGDMWLAVRSASGDVAIHGAELRNSRLTTVSGDVTLDALFTNVGNYGAETVSGDVSIDAIVPGNNVRATLGFGTISGSIRVEGSWEKHKRREWHVGQGEAGASINVKTVSGDLSAKATLDAGVEARSLKMPSSTSEHDEDQGDIGDDFKQDMRDVSRGMKEYYKGMKQYSKEMKRTEKHMSPVPPIPPVPPTPPTPSTPTEWSGSHVFNTGPADPDANRREASEAQPTEPVVPPTPFTDESATEDADHDESATVIAMDGGDHQPAPSEEETPENQDERLRVLEALEKGEIDIEDALAQLEKDQQRQPS